MGTVFRVHFRLYLLYRPTKNLIQYLCMDFSLEKDVPSAEKSSPQMVANQEMLCPMVADQEVGSPQLFLSVCLIAELKRGGRVSHSILLLLDYKYSILIIKICRVGSLYKE